jgi:hypothetical protein
MSARLPAIWVCQLNLRRLSERVRQQAGSCRLEYAQRTGALRLTQNVGALARDWGVSAKFTATVRTRSPASRLLQIGVCPVNGSVEADAKCRCALARDWGVSATFTSAVTHHSPASRLLQIGVDAEISRMTTICRSRLAGERVWRCYRAGSASRTEAARMSFHAVLINCTATPNIITATIRSSRRHVVGRASQGASQAAPMASVENHNTEALAAPAT